MSIEASRERGHLLVWEPFERGNRPPTTTCIFSDGICEYWVGWWSNTDRCIYLKVNYDASIKMGDYDFAKVKWWAHLGNFVSETGGVH